MDERREAVLLLHGLWMNRVAMFYLGRVLARSGFAPVSLSYRSMRGGIDEHLAEIGECIASIPAEVVHLVGHSFGGAVALRYLQQAPDARIGRTVLLGSPVIGSGAALTLAKRPGGRVLLGTSLAIWQSELDLGIGKRYCVGAIAGSRPLGLARLVVRLAGPNDGVVTVKETRLPALADHIVLPVSHSGMLVSAKVARQTAAFLRLGRFER